MLQSESGTLAALRCESTWQKQRVPTFQVHQSALALERTGHWHINLLHINIVRAVWALFGNKNQEVSARRAASKDKRETMCVFMCGAEAPDARTLAPFPSGPAECTCTRPPKLYIILSHNPRTPRIELQAALPRTANGDAAKSGSALFESAFAKETAARADWCFFDADFNCLAPLCCTSLKWMKMLEIAIRFCPLHTLETSHSISFLC